MEEKTEVKRQRLIEWVNSMTQQQVLAVEEFRSLINDYNHLYSNEIMTKLGYTSFDTAKPQPFMDKLRDMGIPEHMLRGTVWDYSENRVWGQLSHVVIKYFQSLINTLES